MTMAIMMSEDQQELARVLRRFFAQHAPVSTPSSNAWPSPDGLPTLWQRMSKELGLPGLHLPEDIGGAGAGLYEVAVVLQEAGRGLVLSPYKASVLASLLLHHHSSDALRSEWLPHLAGGDRLVVVASVETGSQTGVSGLATTVSGAGPLRCLSGHKTLVEFGDAADALIVSAREDDGRCGLFLVRSDDPGVRARPQESLDLQRRYAEVRFQDAVAEPLDESAHTSAEPILDLDCLLLSCEMLGAAEACLDMAVAYAKQRIQFGRAIGSFQSIKNKCADMAVAIDGARVMVDHAVAAAADEAPHSQTAIALAKAEVTEALTLAAGENIQVHGGIGFTWEHPAHLYFRRAWSDSILRGGAAAQRARAASLWGWSIA
jgi:alkylation response protein AidB-like acyl-CoA dehydrogenase